MFDTPRFPSVVQAFARGNPETERGIVAVVHGGKVLRSRRFTGYDAMKAQTRAARDWIEAEYAGRAAQ